MDEEERLKFFKLLEYVECCNRQVKDDDPQEFQRIQQELEHSREAVLRESVFDDEEAGSWLHGFKNYQEYLRSDEWKQKSGDKLASTNGLCELCGENATQAHHKHYKTKYNEKLTDLESLCDSCHRKRTFG